MCEGCNAKKGWDWVLHLASRTLRPNIIRIAANANSVRSQRISIANSAPERYPSLTQSSPFNPLKKKDTPHKIRNHATSTFCFESSSIIFGRDSPNLEHLKPLDCSIRFKKLLNKSFVETKIIFRG